MGSESTVESSASGLHAELMEIFAEDLPDVASTDRAAAQVFGLSDDAPFSDLIHILTNMRYEPEEAKRMWRGILEHRETVGRSLGRDMGLRVSALDYFSNILKTMARPRVVDPQILERLYRDATVDPLTGLANRRHFLEHLTSEISRSRRYSSTFVLGIFDVDDFKQINDTLGHAAGDRVLKEVSRIFQGMVRDSDMVARWGGEEIVLLMPETPKRGAVVLADRIRERIKRKLAARKVTVSGGIASYPSDGKEESELFTFADRALYRAKSEGKDRICSAPNERRAFLRLDANLKVRITPVEGADEILDTETRNVGGGGIAFRHSEVLEISSRIRGEIEIGERLVSFFGRVARVEEVFANEYEVGVQFGEITEEDRQLVMSYSV